MSRARDNANNWAADITAVSAGVGITGGGTSGAVTVTNEMATTIDAKGDLVVGSGADAFTRLAVGTNEQRIVANSATTSGLAYVADTTNYAIGAKGDLLVGTAADTVSALTVGSNDTVLTADSSTATGLKWATPSGGAPYLAQKVVNNWYGIQGKVTGGSGYSPVQNTTYFIPIYLTAGTYDRLRIRVSGNSGTSIDFRVGIYNASSTTGLPTTVVLDAGLLTTGTGTGNYDKTINQTLTSGFYYLAVNKQGSDPFGQLYASYTDNGLDAGPTPAGVGFMNNGNWDFVNSLNFPRVSGVSGAFGTVSSISSYGGNAPWIMIRLAS